MKFFGLHAHGTNSQGDAINYPEEHFKFVIENAGDESMGLAMTDHGNANSFGHVFQATQNLKKKGINFHHVLGCELYIHPNIEQWKIEKAKIKEDKKSLKLEEENDSIVEIESDSKDKSKWYNPLNRRHHLVVLAQNREGFENLNQIVSWSYKNGFYRYPRADFSVLEKFNKNLIISTACCGGLPTFLALREHEKGKEAVFKAFDLELKPLLDIFGKERAYLELQFNSLPQQKIINEYLVEYSKMTGYKCISTADSHYARPELWREREIYKMLAQQTKGYKVSPDDLPKSIDELKCELYPKNGDQMFASYKQYHPELDELFVKESIERTYEIGHIQIESFNPDSSFKLPIRKYENNKSSADKLRELCFESLKNKNLQNNEIYIQRLNKELNVVFNKKFEDYFLLLKEALDEIRKEMLLGTSRGSGGGSIICYLLNITTLDPVKHNLLFERFLSENRNECPDVDTDCEDRERALEILRNHFGIDNVISISNFNTLQLKSLTKDISKLYSIPFEESNSVTSIMEFEARQKILDEIGNDQKLYSFTFDGAMRHSPTFKKYIEKYPQVGESIEVLFKQIKSTAKHASGVCIVREPEKYMPLIKIRGELQTPWADGLNIKSLENFGIIKVDVLGLSTLKIIRNCIYHILKKQKIEPSFENISNFYYSNFSPDVLGKGDINVIKEIYHKGKFLSIFQFSEVNVQKFAIDAKPETISDISNITALWRPGPIHGNAPKNYLNFDYSNEEDNNPILSEILGPTRNVLIFQEQFMQLGNRLAGFSLTEADELRKLLSKPAQSLGEELKKKRVDVGEKFIKGCIDNGLSEKRASRLWFDEILGHISYSFNASHSCGYAMISYICAYLFYHHPIEWVAAVLENESQGKPEEKQRAISLVKSFGFNVIMPTVNLSTDKWQILDDKTVIAPYTFIKSVGEAAIPHLVNNQPYSNIEALLFNDNIDYRKVNVRVLKALVLCGALDSLIDERFDGLAHFFEVVAEKPKTKKKFDELIISTKGNITEYTNQQRFIDKSALLGYLDLDLLISQETQDKLIRKDIPSISNYDIDQHQYCWGYISSFEEKTSAKGNQYILLKILGSAFDEFEILLFGSSLDKMKENKCALLQPAKNIGSGKFCVYENKIRWIE